MSKSATGADLQSLRSCHCSLLPNSTEIRFPVFSSLSITSLSTFPAVGLFGQPERRVASLFGASFNHLNPRFGNMTERGERERGFGDDVHYHLPHYDGLHAKDVLCRRRGPRMRPLLHQTQDWQRMSATDCRIPLK